MRNSILKTTIGGSVLLAMVGLALLAPWLGTVDPLLMDPQIRLQGSSGSHFFGTDLLGRDVYSRVVYGARVSLLIGFGVVVFAGSIGLLVGLLAGYLKAADMVLMRIMDGIMAIPSILLAISFMALSKGSLVNVIAAIGIAQIPRVARLVRSTVLSLRSSLFIDSAVVAGASTPQIIVKHILPNCVSPLIVQLTYIFASAMITEAILSFIGAGPPPITPSWGNIMSDGKLLWQVKFSLLMTPALFLIVTVLAINLLGDGLRDTHDKKSAD